MTDRPKTVTRTATANCHACPFTTNSLGNAARHHDAHQHPITTTVTTTVTYGHPTTTTPGQTTIDEALTP